MQAIILAAGMGSRLGKYTQNNTKCMVPINGYTLIERALDALDSAGIKKCIIVAGYKKDNLINFIGHQYKNIEIIWVINEIYDKTNNIYSLYLARDYLLSDDTLLLESDLIFETRIIKELVENHDPTLVVVAPYESWMDPKDLMVTISKENVITSLIPKKYFNYSEKDFFYKTVNIYKFSRDFMSKYYIPFLEAYLHAMGDNEFYEEVLRVIATLEKYDLKAMVLNNHKWYEIDDAQDKDIAEVIFSDTAEERLKKIYSRRGGYWRFPKLLDFSYPVNPYFPTEQMINEMKAYFYGLLSKYPSGPSVQNMLMAKMYNLEQENVLVGNGAEELIRATAKIINGKAGIIYPTVSEYPESLSNAEVIPFCSESINYNIEELLEWSERCDMLVLINPDNPSGNYIKKNDVLCLLDTLKARNKKLLLDESFMDFCDIENGSLLQQELLDKFPNLIMIKSLSMNYGIPGLRLGMLACGDKTFIQNVSSQIPIWNINSFAEYFLQIIGKYIKDYRFSCRLISEERGRFYIELKKIGLFEVYPSQASYFLCKPAAGLNTLDLSSYLLDKHEIFIKDMDKKNGFTGGSWIRLAVRSRQDNDILLEKLKSFKSQLL